MKQKFGHNLRPGEVIVVGNEANGPYRITHTGLSEDQEDDDGHARPSSTAVVFCEDTQNPQHEGRYEFSIDDLKNSRLATPQEVDGSAYEYVATYNFSPEMQDSLTIRGGNKYEEKRAHSQERRFPTKMEALKQLDKWASEWQGDTKQITPGWIELKTSNSKNWNQDSVTLRVSRTLKT